jgi:DUF1009 family protein
MPTSVGLIAGGGDIPRQVAIACRQAGRPVFIVALEGQAEKGMVEGFPHAWVRLGRAADAIDRLKSAGAVEVCMVGPVKRPSLAELMPDWRTARYLARLGFASLGDDALLSAIGQVLEEEGFTLVGAQDLLRGLAAPVGVLTRAVPDAMAEADLRRGLEVARAIGALDVAQGAGVQQGVVLAVEAAEGTDAMLERCAGLRRAGPGGVLVKARKPQQDVRLDLPTIGPTTIERAAAAGLRGIAVEADGALITDRPTLVETADRLGLFVVCLKGDP